MVEQSNKAVVEIFGDEYTMKGNASPEYMNQLASFVDKRMRQISNRLPNLSVSKVAVLTALNIADELSKLKEENEAMVKIMDMGKKKKNNEKNNKDGLF